MTFGVVGLGYWGPNLLRVLTDIRRRVRTICDLDSDRLERFGRRYPRSVTTHEHRRPARDPEIDAIVIATPVFTHYEMGVRSLDAGKHTFVEKPLAPVEACRRYLGVREAARTSLMCGHTFLYSPPVRAIHELLEAASSARCTSSPRAA